MVNCNSSFFLVDAGYCSLSSVGATSLGYNDCGLRLRQSL
jgi:hypothetical protein|nr:MAG TPA: hypothetical protein [Inoviridae sp.]